MHTKKNKFRMKKNFSETVCLHTKFDSRLKKDKKNFGANFQNHLENVLSPSKNANHTISISGNCMASIFSRHLMHELV